MDSDQVPAAAIAALPVAGAQFCDFQAQELILSKSGGIFDFGKYTVRDVKQKEVFAVDGTIGCGRQRRIMDPNKKVLLILRKQMFSFCNKWKAYLNEETETLLFNIQKRCFRLKFILDVYLGGENAQPDFTLKGCSFTGKYNLYRNDTKELIAKAKYKWTLGSIVRCHTYGIQIEPGVDSVFAISVFLVMNEIFLDRPSAGGD